MSRKICASSKPGKQRKALYTADSAERRIRMTAPLSKELKKQYNVRHVPIRKNDEVVIVSGRHKEQEGKVVSVYRKKYVIHVDKVTRENQRGQTKHIGIDASNVVITKLHLDKDRKALLARKNQDNMHRVISCLDERKADMQD